MNKMRTRAKKSTKKTHLSSDSGPSSPIISSSKTSSLLTVVFCVALEAMLLRAFSRSESRYSCETSSSSSSELPPSSDSDPEEDEEDDGLEDADDGERERERELVNLALFTGS